MSIRFTHLIEVEVPVSPEDYECISVCLHVMGIPGSTAYYDKNHGWQPPDDRELELLLIEIQDANTKRFRKAVPSCYPDIFDQHILDAVDTWWDDHCDECWESADV